MRVPLLSDMHGNAVAFRAALDDLEGDGPDLIVALGDVAQGGPQPRECVDLLRELGCPCVFGKDVVLPETPLEEVGPLEADAVAAGHVHQQWLRRFGHTFWFCGAIGVGPWCEYALVDDQSLAVEFRRIPFDLDELVADARAKDFPHFDRWVQSWKE